MLDPWIIEDIRRREQEREEENRLPLYREPDTNIEYPIEDREKPEESPGSARGVVVIDLLGDD